jgi:hypothetical protein
MIQELDRGGYAEITLEDSGNGFASFPGQAALEFMVCAPGGLEVADNRGNLRADAEERIPEIAFPLAKVVFEREAPQVARTTLPWRPRPGLSPPDERPRYA